MGPAAAVVANCPKAVAGQAIDPFAVTKSEYHSEKLSQLTNIAQMQEPELRAFARYLAECSDNEDTDVSKHACSTALTSYEIEFGSDGGTRPLDRLIYVRSELAKRPPEVRARDVRPEEVADWAIRELKYSIGA